jgi:hypothetical protein
MRSLPLAVVMVLVGLSLVAGETLSLPARPAEASGGASIAMAVSRLSREDRESRLLDEILRGNVPDFLRHFRPVTLTHSTNGQSHSVTIQVAADYLAVGSDADYMLVPLSPAIAQKIADAAGCLLPTRRIADAIHAAADVKLTPSPIPPTPAMTTMPVFVAHNETVRRQRLERLKEWPLGALVAGDKKDVVITTRLASAPDKVAIYGWHRTNGTAIQPLYLGHTAAWVDYSHGIRLIHKMAMHDGKPQAVAEILADPILAPLLSDEGPVAQATYPFAATAPRQVKSMREFKAGAHFDEQILDFTLDPEIRVHVNAPSRAILETRPSVQLVIFTLPNGNTIEQTAGKRMAAGDDWHFDIQHIAAQIRFLRARDTNTAIVVAYLEAGGKSWPAWRKKNGSGVLPGVVTELREILKPREARVVLSGHSGGGSFIFGLIESVLRVPDYVERIAFLDSNYAYDREKGHDARLVEWLRGDSRRALVVLAYNDAVALLNGKSFVSESGGTWGRSHAMIGDFGKFFNFARTDKAGMQTHSALDGRVKFLLKENPDRAIFHTVQVERNGLIHCLLIGTPDEGKGYEYFGARAYGEWVK